MTPQGGWFGLESVIALANHQQRGTYGLSPSIRTMVAAYKQFKDIEFILSRIDFSNQWPPEMQKIKERHDKYKEIIDKENTNGHAG